jgi:ATPase involved in DNA repair
MIKHLYIKNFVLIDELNLDLHPGFSVFTGETGAGKSILIDAISLLCADRANTALIQKGAERAVVEGTFDLQKDAHGVKDTHKITYPLVEQFITEQSTQKASTSVVRMAASIRSFHQDLAFMQCK